MNATTKVIEGKLCVEVDGVKAWYTAAHVDKWIAKLEGELAKWKERRALLTASEGERK